MAWDWLKLIPTWDWHALALKGWPNWEREPGSEEPCRVDLTFVAGKGRSSHQLAAKFDDIARWAFFYRDFTEDNIPFVRDGESYRSSFWFKRRKDRERFLEMLKC